MRGDMIEIFKTVHNICDADTKIHLPFSSNLTTSGNKYKL